MSKGADRIEHTVNVLRTWQGLERQALNDTAEIIQETDNELVRIVMEIIRNDSLMHHRVQQFLVDSLTKKDVHFRKSWTATSGSMNRRRSSSVSPL